MARCEYRDQEISMDAMLGTTCWARTSEEYWHSSLKRLRSKALFGMEMALFLLLARYLIPDPKVLAGSTWLLTVLGAGAVANLILRLPNPSRGTSTKRRVVRAILGFGLALLVLATGYLSPDPKVLEGTKWLAMLLGSSAAINLLRIWWSDQAEGN